jgi:hypothetical protein
VFTGASPAGQAAILRNAPGLARTIGAQAQQLLALVAESPAGSDKLLIHMLHVLTGARHELGGRLKAHAVGALDKPVCC